MVTVTKSKAEQVVQALLNKIVEENLKPGSALGTEADLLATYDVSRPTLRESLRILESQGVIEMRPGPGGGILVRHPSVDVLAHGLSVFLRLHDVPFISVLQAREVIEPHLAREAAMNGAESDFAEMEASIQRMRAIKDDHVAFINENRIFHSVVARASGNKVLETFWSTISLLADGEHHGMRYSFGNQKHVVEAHERILEACRKRDGAAAAAQMGAHVAALEHLVRNRYKYLLDQPTSVLAREGRRIV
jgi:GntR family transcriptional repressor for pyruvate dehydrogenase complex